MNDNYEKHKKIDLLRSLMKWATFQLQIYDIYTIKDIQVIFSVLP